MSTDRRRLLFLDDIPEDAEIAAWHLKRAGIDVDYDCVAKSDQFLDSLALHIPELILSDICLPQWDCWDALRLARQHLPGVPFALYSGSIGVEDARLAMMRGVFGTAEKDVPTQLISLVRRALGLQ